MKNFILSTCKFCLEWLGLVFEPSIDHFFRGGQKNSSLSTQQSGSRTRLGEPLRTFLLNYDLLQCCTTILKPTYSSPIFACNSKFLKIWAAFLRLDEKWSESQRLNFLSAQNPKRSSASRSDGCFGGLSQFSFGATFSFVFVKWRRKRASHGAKIRLVTFRMEPGIWRGKKKQIF